MRIANWIINADSRKGSRNIKDVVAISHDEKIGVYTLSEDIDKESVDEPSKKKDEWRGGDVRDHTKCSYVVDILPRADGGASIVTGNFEESGGYVEIWGLGHTGGKKGTWEVGKESIRLEGGHGGEICRCVWIGGEEGVVFTGGEDGKVRVWKGDAISGGSQGGEEDEEDEDEEARRKREKKEKKEKKREKKEKERFKPY